MRGPREYLYKQSRALLALGFCLLISPLSIAVRAANAEPSPKTSATATEDVIYTTAGTAFRGKIVRQDGRQVIIETKSGQVAVPRAIIKELRLGSVDYRPASKKIKPLTIPKDQAPGFLKKAEEHFKKGQMEQTAAICEGLLALGGKALSAPQRESVGKMMAGAYFELKDWPASARGLRRAAVAIGDETDRQRLLAVAEALEAYKPPSIGGQTVEDFAQAQQAAMKWKAELVFDNANEFVEEAKELYNRSSIERALKVAQLRLAKAEIYVPGYSIRRQPELVKTLVGRMMKAVKRANAVCVERRKALMRAYFGNVDRRHAESWNRQCASYLGIIRGSRDCLNNVKYLARKYPIKDLYSPSEHKKLGDDAYKLQYYDSNLQAGRRTIRLKGKKIALIKFGHG